ncbi:hypothetical protein LINPERHAP2_LOCUS6403 [Linum perenne]
MTIPSVAKTTTPATIPSDRPPEPPRSVQLPPPSETPTGSFSLGTPGGQGLQSMPKSFLGAVRGDSSSNPGNNQTWIPVGVSDITLSASNGIKSLSLSKYFKEKLCIPWRNSVVVRLLGKSVGYAYLCNRLRAIWKPLGHLHIVDLDKDCFMIKFTNEQDYFKALTGGPWTILDHYLIVHQWDQSFRVANDLPRKMVVWVRFPHLPIHFYHARVLTSLGNLIGKTVKIDFNTQRAERGKFARIAIEINLDEPIPPVVLLDGVIQKVEYENMPTLCFECGRVGHDSQACPRNSATPPTAVATSAASKEVVTAGDSSEPAADRYGPWMLVSRRPRRPNKEGSPSLVRQDLRGNHSNQSGEIGVSVKERGIGIVKSQSGANEISKTQKGKHSVPNDVEGGANKAKSLGHPLPSSSSSAAVHSGRASGSQTGPSGVAKPKRNKKSAGATARLGREGEPKSLVTANENGKLPADGPPSADSSRPATDPSAASSGLTPAQVNAKTSPAAAEGDANRQSVFHDLPPPPVAAEEPPRERPPTSSKFRRTPSRRQKTCPSLKSASLIARVSSSGLSKSATKVAAVAAAKALFQQQIPPPAVGADEPSCPGEGGRADEEVLADDGMLVDEDVALVIKEANGVAGTCAQGMTVDPVSLDKEAGRVWDLNSPSCV